MKVVICGAGQVGFYLARYLSADGHDVTVIDNAPDVVRHVMDSLDVQVIEGEASHPNVLNQADVGAADVLIAVTQRDEVNMMACQVAHSLFKTPTKIARIRAQSFLDPQWGALTDTHIPIDFIISPELEVALAIERTLTVPGAFEVFHLASGLVCAIGVRAREGMPILRTQIQHIRALYPGLEMSVCAFVREGDFFIPGDEDMILPGDIAYVVVPTRDIHKAMEAFDYREQKVQRVIVLGSGGVGLRLVHSLFNSQKAMEVFIIERDRQRANFVAQETQGAIVLNGDALDAEILKEAGVEQADAVIAITNDDKINILSALLAKNLGARQAICLVNKIVYSSLIFPLGIDALINPRAITASSILKCLRRGRMRKAHSIQDGKGEIMDIEVFGSSAVVGQELQNLNLPKTAMVAAFVRNNGVMDPKARVVLETGDRLVLVSTSEATQKIEKIFSARS